MSSSSSPSSFSDQFTSLLQSDEFKAYMQSTLREVLASQGASDQASRIRDEQVVPPVVTMLYTPSESERERCPDIKMVEPKDFFRRSVSNDDWSNGLRQYPKNTCATYDPPNLPAVAQCPDTIKAHDNQLSRIQCDIAHLTRPIDHLIHLVLSTNDIPEDSEQLFVNFANHMRGQLASLASKITRVRMENIRKSKGIPTSDNSNLLFDPQAFNEEIKTAKALAAAFALQKQQ